ncbi:hypothetical protein C8A05DRAFT_14579 [Staphylotrichum tortipilum]|uniref:BHLH domain-containing protein n=1 Tax=Staphylotrichum tortipilum TaxID=2831512 RepID=A0AAN6RUG3_9PEZI|nr:hypothetical protein C8A05DRAFT_14579 [Staphylotrichum longicolle]
MAQHGFPMSGHGGIDPNDLSMTGSFQPSFQNNYSSSAIFADDELLDGLSSPTDAQPGVQEFGNMNEMGIAYSHGVYGSHHGLPMGQHTLNGYSSTPDGDPIQSPFVHNNYGFRSMQHAQSFGAMKSPVTYAASPLAKADLNDNTDPNFLNTQSQRAAPHLAAAMRKSTSTRGSVTPKTAAMGLDSTYGAQPIRATGAHHEKSHSGQWMQTPNSLSSFPGSGYSSPLQAGIAGNQMNDIILKGGASMPAKLGAPASAASTQEARRKRRRESHNLVERRRRDNINERIQDLSKLVPAHRLEDEKVRKAISNGTPLSPTLSGVGAPSQATSALAGPGARRAAGGSAGNITTGLPIEDKDKGPNKGDILNGAVSWTRDLMWMLHLKIQQQEELINALYERGGQLPFEITDDERRMQTELMEAVARNDELQGQTQGQTKGLSYTRTAGSGLRVPHHTDYKGDTLGSNGNGMDHGSASPGDDGAGGMVHDMLDQGDFLYDDDGSGDIEFKEEDEFGMDTTV